MPELFLLYYMGHCMLLWSAHDDVYFSFNRHCNALKVKLELKLNRPN